MQEPDVRPIIDIVSLCFHSAGVAARRPVSVLLCSPPDNGKTVWIMDRFQDNSGIHRVNMATRIGLAKWLFTNKRYQKIHHIMM